MRSRAFRVGWRSLLSCVLWGCSGWLFAREPVPPLPSAARVPLEQLSPRSATVSVAC